MGKYQATPFSAKDLLKSAFSSPIDFLRTIGKLASFLGFFLILGIIGLVIGNKLLALVAFAYFISIILRIPDTYADMFVVESVGIFGLLIYLVTGSVALPIFFVFTGLWLTRFTSPFGPTEEYADTIDMCVGYIAGILALPFLVSITGGNLLTLIFYYNLVRIPIMYFTAVFTFPALYHRYLPLIPIVIVFSTMQIYAAFALIGAPVLNAFGIQNFVLPPFRFLK